MYLSDRDMECAIRCRRLIVDPPTKIGPTSIDLHLDKVEEAKVWDIARYKDDFGAAGHPEAELPIGKFIYAKFAPKYLISPSAEAVATPETKVFIRDRKVIVKPGGFVLWQTKERVGTPEERPDLICFVDGKSTRARTGLLVHMTAPTIHAGWSGKVTLEIANLGPFHFVLEENDVIAQIVVARISSSPNEGHREAGSATLGQQHVTASLE
jgi:dCTP deaminase